MSWIRKTADDKYRAEWRDPDGKQCSKSFTLERDAKRWLAKQTTDIAEGTYTPPALGREKVGAYFSKFLASSNIRPATLDRYERHYRLYLKPAFGNRRLASISPTEIRAWKQKLAKDGIGASTIASSLRLLKTVLNRAVADEIIGRSPARGVKNESTDPEGGLRVLEVNEVDRLAQAIEERHRTLVYLLAYRGPRMGEAAALRVGDIDLMRGRMRIEKTLSEVKGQLIEGPPKTKAGSRTVSLPPFLVEMLTQHLDKFARNPKDRNAYVFTMDKGGPIRANNFRKRAFEPAVDAAKLDADLTPHDLRDTAATLAFSAGATVKEVSNMLGHANPAITLKRYTGVLESMSERTDAALDATFRAASAKNAASSAASGSATVVQFPSSE
jgi:integrase